MPGFDWLNRGEEATEESVTNFEDRLTAIEEVLVEVAAGNLMLRVPANTQANDRLTSIEVAINLILSDLEEETSHRLMLKDALDVARGGSDQA